MGNEDNIKQLVQDLSKENEELKKYIASLLDELSVYKEHYGDNWIHAKDYLDAIKEARKAKDEFNKETQEVRKMKAEYKAKLDEMLDKYKLKK